MSKIKVEVEVSKEAMELGMGLVKFVAAMRMALADGWQTGSDLPAVMASAISDLVPALNGAQNMAEELAEDKVAFAKAMALSLAEIAEMFAVKK